MDVLATPYLRINKNFLGAIGLWPHQSGVTKYLLLFNTLFFTITQGYLQIGGMIAAWEDKNVFLESIPPVLVDFICAAKIINFLVNSKRMKNLLVTLEEDWRRLKGRDEIEIMNKSAMYGRRLTYLYLGCMYGAMASFMIIPAVPVVVDIFGFGNKTLPKQLMFRVDFLIDAEKYYYPLLIHSYFGTVAYITLIVAIDTMIMVYVQHACGCFTVLGYQLEHLTDGIDINVDVYPQKNNDTSYYNMSNCIVQHNHALQLFSDNSCIMIVKVALVRMFFSSEFIPILRSFTTCSFRYSKLIEDTNYMSYFFQLGITMVCLSFTEYQTVIYIETPEIAARYFGFTLTQLLMLILQSYPGQMLHDHSIQVSEYVNNSRWYQTSIRTRKLFCLMTMRSRVPCHLTAGRFYLLNVANFGAVVRTSLSYLTVLTSVK